MRKGPLFIIVSALVVLTAAPTRTQSVKTLDSTAQQKSGRVDSINQKVRHHGDTLQQLGHSADSTYQYKHKQLDSLQRDFHHRTDSLQKAYAAPIKKLDAEIAKLNHKKDSLSRLKLPTPAITHKIDSTTAAQKKMLNDLNGQIAKVKAKALSKVSSLHLPPEAQKEIGSELPMCNMNQLCLEFTQACAKIFLCTK